MTIRVASQSFLDLLTRILLAACVLVGGLMAFLGVRAVLDSSSARSLNAESAVLEQQAKKHAAEMAKIDAPGAQRVRGLDALRILQDAVTKNAVNHGCTLAEFKAATQTAPYTPRYKRETPDEPWSQMDAHFTLVGRLRAVMETLQSLKDAPVAFEIDGLNLAREHIDANGTTTVTAQVDLRALSQGASA